MDHLTPALERGFKKAEPAVSRFVQNLGAGFRRLEPMIEPVSAAFSAVLDDLGPRLPAILGGIEKSMSRLARAVEENPKALGQFVEAAGEVVEVILNIIAALTWAEGKWRDFQHIITFGMAEGSESVGDFTPIVTEASQASLDLARSAEETAKAQRDAAQAAADHARQLQDLTTTMYGQISAGLALDESVDQSDEAMRDYTDAVRDHGVRSEEASDALLGLRGAALQVAEATRDNTLAQQSASGKAEDLVAANTAARNALLRMADTAKGPAREAILAQAAAVDALVAKLNATNRTFNANIVVHTTYQGTAPGSFNAAPGRTGLAHGGITGAAGGGPRSNRTLVGEHGPEIVDLAPGSMVHPAGESQRMLGQGGGAQRVEIVLRSDGSRLSDLLLELFQEAVRDRGGLKLVFPEVA